MKLHRLLPFAVVFLAACGSSTAAPGPTDASSFDASAPSDGSMPPDANVPPDAVVAPDANAPPDAGNDAAMSSGKKRAFVTSTTYTGLIDPNSNAPNGVDDGDKACNALAQQAGLGGTWQSFLPGYTGATGSVSATDHLAGVGPWYLVDGATLVFANKAALASGPASAFDRDERGHAVAAGSFAWSTTVAATGDFCNAWTSMSPNNHGGVGKIGATTPEWAASTSPGLMTCDQANHLYCFEE